MLDELRRRLQTARNRLRRLERREMQDLRVWLEDTRNFLHLTALVFVPLLIAGVTWLSNVSPVVSFLVYPPLASGTYTLFADPHGEYASPRRFVGGIVAGALCGWLSLELTSRIWYAASPERVEVQAGAAGLAVLFTAVITWVFALEEPTAFSTALLVLVSGTQRLNYLVGITVSSLLVAAVFVVWQRSFYLDRENYLYRSTRGDDQVLVPVREDAPDSLATFAARLAAAHDAGRVVLLATVPPDELEAPKGGSSLLVSETPSTLTTDGGTTVEDVVTEQALQRLRSLEEQIEATVEVPCEFVVAVEERSAGETVLATARSENCDLIVCPYETDDGGLSSFVRTILGGDTDAVVYRPSNGRSEWRRVLVMVRSPGRVANAMLNFAHRLAGMSGRISACTCITDGSQRRSAERQLENVVDTVPGAVETRISQRSVEEYLEEYAAAHDIAFVGASTDRSVASRTFSTPTFERIHELDCDLAIVHRGR